MYVIIQHYSQVVFTFSALSLRLLLLAVVLPVVHGGVRFERVPDSGIQPQVVIDPRGAVHLLYFKGDAMGGDVYYARKESGQKSFSSPIQANSTAGSVIVAGTMRGPQMAIGGDGRAHIVWMGGNGAPKVEIGGEKVAPLLYARMTDSRDRFEPERNILTHIAGLDGGQTVAADNRGNVYVVWHGAAPGTESEEERGLFVAHSANDGKTFAREIRAKVPRKGACACCGIRAKVDSDGALHVLFRAAEAGVNRSELWLKSSDQGRSFAILQEDPWKTATCPASSASLSFAAHRSAAAWETDNRVVGAFRGEGGSIQLRPAGKGKQKHPTIAVNAKGEALMTWVEDAGWGTAGTLVCQIFDANGKPASEPIRKSELPAWSFGAPYVDANGSFVVLY